MLFRSDKFTRQLTSGYKLRALLAARGLRRARPAAQILTSLRLSKFVVYARDVMRKTLLPPLLWEERRPSVAGAKNLFFVEVKREYRPNFYNK